MNMEEPMLQEILYETKLTGEHPQDIRAAGTVDLK